VVLFFWCPGPPPYRRRTKDLILRETLSFLLFGFLLFGFLYYVPVFIKQQEQPFLSFFFTAGLFESNK
jgi:hypothetical protein